MRARLYKCLCHSFKKWALVSVLHYTWSHIPKTLRVLHNSVVKFVTKITPKRYDFHASKHRSANYIFVDSSLVRLVMHWNLQKIRWTWKCRRQNVSSVKSYGKTLFWSFFFCGATLGVIHKPRGQLRGRGLAIWPFYNISLI